MCFKKKNVYINRYDRFTGFTHMCRAGFAVCIQIILVYRRHLDYFLLKAYFTKDTWNKQIECEDVYELLTYQKGDFFFSFAYKTSPAAVMKLVVFFRSSKPTYNFWWSGVADGHCAIRSGWCLLHIWRTWSVVWSSSPQRHVGEGTIFSFLCACALSLLWPNPPGRACQEGGMHQRQPWVF